MKIITHAKTLLIQMTMMIVALVVGMPSLVAIKNPKTFILTLKNTI